MPLGKAESKPTLDIRTHNLLADSTAQLQSSRGPAGRSNIGSFKAESEKLRGSASNSNRSRQLKESGLQ